MIVEQALTLAGPDAVLAARPAGVAHVYAGRLTRSGRSVPGGGRVLCRATTRRLHVVEVPAGWSTLDPAGRLPRLCARCAACLRHAASTPRGGWPTGRQAPREYFRRTFEHLSLLDLWAAAAAAVTPAELDVVGYLSLALYGHVLCTRPVARPDGRDLCSLHRLITDRRAELVPDPVRAEDFERHRIAGASARAAQAELTRIRRDNDRGVHGTRRTYTRGAPL